MADIYGLIPDVDSRGIAGQIAKFRQWNPDPLGAEAKNLAAVNPQLAAVVARARADNPNLRFVLGSGLRTAAQQDLAHGWGWSPIGAKGGGDADIHMRGNAVDIWPLNDQGQVTFDSSAQKAVSDAMKAAAAELKVNLTAGGDWKHPDQPHFEMTGNPAWTPAASQPARPGQTTNSQPTTVTASTPFSLSAPSGSIPSAGPYQPLIDAAAKKYNIDPNFFSRLLWQENRFRPQGTSPAGAQGFAQFIPSTAARYGVNVNDPASSIEGAAHYLSDLSTRYGGNMGLMAAGYNWGENNVDKWVQGKSKPPSETINYVNTITGHSMDEWKADPRLPLGPFTGPGRAPSGTTPGTTINSAPGVATAAAPGGQSWGDKLETVTKDVGKAMGWDQPANAGGGEGEFKFQPMPPASMRNVSPLLPYASAIGQKITGYSPQIYGQSLTSMKDPLQWGTATPGQNPWAGAGPQAPPGTSLTSMNPMQMQAAMLAPYYGYGLAGMGDFGGASYG